MHSLITLFLIGALHAQSVIEVPTDPDALAGWLNRSTEVQIQVPAEATGYAVSFGPDRIPLAMAGTLHEPAGIADRLLRVLIVPPDQPGGNGICDDGGLAGIFITQTSSGLPTSPNYVPFCAPYPERPGRDELAIVVHDHPAKLGQWQPIYLHSWNARPGLNGGLDHRLMFSVHVSFTDTNSTAIPQARRPSVGDILELDSAREQLADHD